MHYTGGKGYYQQFHDDANYNHDTKYTDYGLEPITVDGVIREKTDLIRQKWLDNDFFGVVASANYSLDKLDISFGASANRYLGDHFGQIKWMEFNHGLEQDYQWYYNYGKKEEVSSFIKFNYEAIEGLNLFVDAQVRKMNYTMSGIDDDLVDITFDKTYNFFNPKLGLSYIKDNFSTYASVSIANREPARADLKEAIKECKDVLPTSERLIDYELGAKYYNEIMSFDANIYYMDYTDKLINTGKRSNSGYKLM